MTKQNTNPAGVSVIGLGAMGTALASTFLKAGYNTTVWNRTPEKADLLVQSGAKKAATISAAISSSPLTVICVLDYDAVYDLLGNLEEPLSGRVLVNLTNGTPLQARQMASWANEKGVVGYIDGGIMAVPSLIGKPDAFILYSGSADGFKIYKEVLEKLGSAKFLGTDSGLASLLDLALLSGMYGMFAGFLQAVALADSAHIPATDFTNSLLIPWLHAMITIMPEMAYQMDTGNYTSKEANLAMQVSGARLTDFSKSQGVNSDLLAPLENLMHERVANGFGGDDFASVIEIIRKKRS